MIHYSKYYSLIFDVHAHAEMFTVVNTVIAQPQKDRGDDVHVHGREHREHFNRRCSRCSRSVNMNTSPSSLLIVRDFSVHGREHREHCFLSKIATKNINFNI